MAADHNTFAAFLIAFVALFAGLAGAQDGKPAEADPQRAAAPPSSAHRSTTIGFCTGWYRSLQFDALTKRVPSRSTVP